MLDEVGGKDRADRVEPAEECRGDTVEPHAGDGGGRALPLLKAGQVQQRGAEAGERAGDHQREDDVAFFRHAAILGGKPVVAGRLELVAEFGLVQHDPDKQRHQHRRRNGNRYIGIAVKDLVQSQRRQDRLTSGIFELEGIGGGRLLDVGEDHVRRIEHDPVEHDAGDDLADIERAFEQARDHAEQRARRDGQQHARQPVPVQIQSRIQTGARARDILTGRADVEQANLIHEQHAQRAHEQRRGPHEGVAEVFELGLGRGVRQEVLHDVGDGAPGARGVDEKQNKIADEKTEQDAQQRRQQRLDPRVFENVFVLFHAFTSSLLAPAM